MPRSRENRGSRTTIRQQPKSIPLYHQSDDPVADIFEPPNSKPNPTGDVTLTIEMSGPRHWVLHRSDGRCGGIFIDRKSALHEARQEASMLSGALIVITEANGDVIREHFRAGRPTPQEYDAGLSRELRTLARAA